MSSLAVFVEARGLSSRDRWLVENTLRHWMSLDVFGRSGVSANVDRSALEEVVDERRRVVLRPRPPSAPAAGCEAGGASWAAEPGGAGAALAAAAVAAQAVGQQVAELAGSR